MKGAIIIGYPGIGKSTLARDTNGYIDLDSGNFHDKNDTWYLLYCSVAVNLAYQGYTVMISSHKCVQDFFRINKYYFPFEVYVCFPCLALENEWINKLKARSEDAAWRRASTCYSKDILDMMISGFPMITITSMGYFLKELIEEKRYFNEL